MPTSELYQTTVDYPSIIRAELTTLVDELKHKLETYYRDNEGEGGEFACGTVKAQYVTIGYMVNIHNGYALFKDGDFIAGLPVTIDRYLNRTIRVCADEVEFPSGDYNLYEEATR